MKKTAHHRIKRTTLTSSVLKELREKILAGEIKGGAPLRQETLAEEFHVSLIPIREALFTLEAEGLVIIAPHKGAVVAPISTDEIDEIFTLRELLECDILSRAIPYFDEQYARKAEGVLQEFKLLLKPKADLESWGALNWEFHSALYRPAKRERTFKTIEGLHTHCDRYLRLQIHLLVDARSRAHAEHCELLELCRKKNRVAAKKLLREHLSVTRKELIETLQP